MSSPPIPRFWESKPCRPYSAVHSNCLQVHFWPGLSFTSETVALNHGSPTVRVSINEPVNQWPLHFLGHAMRSCLLPDLNHQSPHRHVFPAHLSSHSNGPKDTSDILAVGLIMPFNLRACVPTLMLSFNQCNLCTAHSNKILCIIKKQ